MTNPKLQIDLTKPVTATLFRWMTLRPDGTHIDGDYSDDPDERAEADAAHAELVEIGTGSMAITAVADDELAKTCGCADEKGSLKPTLQAIFTPSTPDGDRPQMGDLLALDFGGFIALPVEVVLTHQDISTPSLFDLDAPPSACFEAIKPGEIVITTLVSDAP